MAEGVEDSGLRVQGLGFTIYGLRGSAFIQDGSGVRSYRV